MANKQTILDELIVSARSALVDNPEDGGQIKRVEPFSESSLLGGLVPYPVVMIVDTGRERIVARDATENRFECDIEFTGVVKEADEAQLALSLAYVSQSIQHFIATCANVSTDMLKLRFIESGESAYSTQQKQGVCQVIARLLYVDARLDPASSPTVYGEAFIDGCTTALLSALGALSLADVNQIAAGHNLARLLPPTITVGIDAVEASPTFVNTGANVHAYKLTASVRIHTGFVGESSELALAQSIAQSVTNYMRATTDLGSGYRVLAVPSVELNRTFDETATTGGQVTITIEVYI